MTLVTGLCKTAILQGQILAMHSSVAVGTILQRIDARKATLEGQVGASIARHDVILRLCEIALDTVDVPSTILTSPPVVETPTPTPRQAAKTVSAKRTGELPEHIKAIAEAREQYEKLTLAEFSQLLYDRNIYRAKDRKTGEEKPRFHWI
jgi:hypothetical protein